MHTCRAGVNRYAVRIHKETAAVGNTFDHCTFRLYTLLQKSIVTGTGSVDECGRLSRPCSELLGAL